MKRLLSLVLVLFLLAGTVASAEEFTLRNGIAFGDTMDEVLEKETFGIAEVVDSIEDNTEEEVAYEEMMEETLPYSIKTKESSLAGIDGSCIIYSFDENKTLREVEYVFRSSTFGDLIDADYESVNAGLISKYGDPLGYTNGDFYIFTGSMVKDIILALSINQMLGSIAGLKDYDEWVVDTEDYHVKIEQLEYYSDVSEGINYCHRVGYTYFTDEQLAEKLDEKQANQETVYGDL